MTNREALDGKPYAGSPHVWFGEGEVASCTAAALLWRWTCRRQPERRASGRAVTPRLCKLMVAVLAALPIAKCARAADAIVSSGDVDALVRALNAAVDGDTITLESGTYDLTGLTPTKTSGYATAYLKLMGKRIILRGESDKHWSLKSPEEETVLRGGNGGAIFYAHGQKPRWSAIYNITFENGRQPADSGNSSKVGGGALSWATSDGCSPSEGYGFVSNCVFRNCGSAYDGGATYGIDAFDCLYTNCYSAANGGGAFGFFKRAANYYHTNLFANCVFVENVAATNGGALYCEHIDTVNGCVFKDNFASNACGGLCSKTLGGTVSDCTFVSNMARRVRLGRQIDKVVDVRCCTFLNWGDIHAKSIDRCIFDGCRAEFVSNAIALVTFDAGTGTGRLANSLFTGCFAPRVIVSAGVMADIENCTFVGNSIAGHSDNLKNWFFYAFKDADTSARGTNCIVNCLFVTNVITSNTSGSEGWDLNFNATAGALNIVSNSLYVSGWGGLPPEQWNFMKGTVSFAAGVGKYSSAPYYMPQRRSAAVDAGLDLTWMPMGVDLAGNPRIVGDHVDIGCYEYVLPISGTVFSIR